MLELQFKKARYALLAARLGGWSYLLNEMKHRTYRSETFIGLVKDLGEADSQIKSRIDYSFQRASPEDIESLLKSIKTEGKEAIFDLVQRIWFYDSGFHNCYVARTIPKGELCHLGWVLSQQDDNAESEIFKSSFPRLAEQDMQVEHAYTFKRYRGNRLMPAFMNQLFGIARQKGLKRVITYVLEDNIPSLNGCYCAGYKQFETVHRTKFPFNTRYEIKKT